ncbi:MAG TPA: M48 family metallopeptidase [Coleofasciculaceae cyanobacterium]|jgi:predicted Zn-dependent protease
MSSNIWLNWRSPTVALGLISLNILPVSASQSTKPNTEFFQERSELVAIDIIDAIQGAVQYIQVSNISDEQEVAIGQQTNEQVLSQYQLYDNPQIQEYVSNLGQELVSNSDSRNIPFNFQVVASDEVNAFATPGGFVYITTGLLKTAENRAQLASVMAHEIAHINEKHGIKNLKQAVAARGIASTVGVDTNTLAQIAYQLTVDLPQSRSFEYEADSSGLSILEQAGYPAQAFADFLVKLESSGGTPEFLRTHPSSENRIDAIAQESQTTQAANSKGQDNTEYQNNVLALL